MPDYPTPRPQSHNYTKNVTISFVDWKGSTKNLRLSNLDLTVTGGEVDALRAAAGKISNAGIFRDALEDDTNMAIKDAITHIDPFAEVSDVGVFRFDHPDNRVESKYVELPAIWGDKVVPGSRVINTSDPDVDDFIDKCLAVLNKVTVFGESYYFAKAFYSDRKGGVKQSAERPRSRDPRNTGVNPNPGGGGGNPV